MHEQHEYHFLVRTRTITTTTPWQEHHHHYLTRTPPSLPSPGHLYVAKTITTITTTTTITLHKYNPRIFDLPLTHSGNFSTVARARLDPGTDSGTQGLMRYTVVATLSGISWRRQSRCDRKG